MKLDVMAGSTVCRAPGLRRRQVMALAGAWALATPQLAAAAPRPTGWVMPRLPAPPIGITGADGRTTALAAALDGKITAVQLMFTGCSSTCPIQGALFAALAGRLRSTGVQLLSISIDALGDSPPSLAAWQARFGRHPAWGAAVPGVADVDRLADFMKGSPAKSGTHTAQVFLFDRRSQLCYRTADAPGVGEIEALLAQLAQLG